MGMKLPPETEKKVIAAPGVNVGVCGPIVEMWPKKPLEAVQYGECNFLLTFIPMQLPSIANCRMHWAKLAKLKKNQKLGILAALTGKPLPPLPCKITLTRIHPKRRADLDTDNLAACFKAVQDQIAAMYGVDDGSDQYTWVYQQRTGKEYGVQILIERRA